MDEGISISTPEAVPQIGVWQQVLWLFRALRPRQWTKNLIVYAAPLFAMKLHTAGVFSSVSLCFIAFCLLSGSVYIINDVLDREADRKHPVKCKRPIASGQISPSTALIFGFVVCTCALALAAAVRGTLALVLIAYLVLQIWYAMMLKHRPLIDVGCIAMGFVLRAIAGAVAAHVPVSGWFLLCTGMGSLFLALEKRRQEIKLLGDDAVLCRKALKKYSLPLLDRLEALVLPGLLVAYMFYTFLSWHGQWMMLTIPFVLYGTARYVMLSVNDKITASPEEVFLKDRPIQVALVLWTLTSVSVLYGLVPKGLTVISHFVDGLGPLK